MPWSKLVEASHSHTTATGSGLTWRPASSTSVLVERRLNHLYPQTEDASGEHDFVWRIQNEFPFFVATGNKVYITSGITDGP